jgi:diguanylate cyclase (GGDEF)-like protein
MPLWLVFTFALLVFAGSSLFILLSRVRDWRAAILLGWLAATGLLMAATLRAQLVIGGQWFGAGHAWLTQMAISGLTVAAALFSHRVFQRDMATGLPNRTVLLARLRRSLHQARRRDASLTLLLLKLDRVKHVKHSMGKAISDRVLQRVALRLPACVGNDDFIARTSWNEFAVLLANVAYHDAEAIAARIRERLADPVVLDGHDLMVGGRIGVAHATATTHHSPTDLMREADLAMTHAKESGTFVEVFDRSMLDRVYHRVRLESSLHGAIDRDELVVHYQPIVDLRDESITGLEALVRWRHPDWGLLLPNDFIPIAEETGLIDLIGLWVLEEACRQMVAWRTAAAEVGLSVHVNLSARQFRRPALVHRIATILQRTGLPPAGLGLEITETVIMEDVERTSAMLGELSALGVHLQIDDFGTGYSSLAYLQRLPVNAVKIDRSFIAAMRGNDDNAKIVRAIVGLAQALDLKVIAEGVETAEHSVLLRSLGCTLAQGDYFSPAVDVTAASELVRRGRTRARHGPRSAEPSLKERGSRARSA